MNLFRFFFISPIGKGQRFCTPSLLLIANLFFVSHSFGQTNTWDGSSSANWNTAANWSLNLVPTAAHDVVIPNGITTTITVNTAAVCSSLTISNGNRANTVSISGANSLTVTNGITIGAGTGGGDNKILAVNAGTLTCASITVTATGNANRTSGVTLSTGTVNVSGSITMGSTDDDFTFTGAGTLNLGNTMTGGTFTASTGTVNYNGAAQTVGTYTYNNLTLSGSGAKDMAGALTIGGAVTLESGVTVTAGAFTHDVGGNWTNNGAAFVSTGSTINLNGAAQTIGGSSSTTFDNLTLAGSSTKTLGIATTIISNLSISSGVVADLGAITTHTANTLTLAGVGQIAGTWGSTTSAATNQTDTYFTAASTGILTTAATGPTTYYTRQTGNWNATTTWSTVTYGNATNNGTIPVAGDIVKIGGNLTVTVTVNAACALIDYESATTNTNTVTINSGITLDVSGEITLPRGNNPDINTMAVGAGILNAGSIAFTNGGGGQRHILSISTGTVTVSGDVTQTGSNGSATITFTGAGLLQLGGAFLTSATATLTPSTGIVEYNGAAQAVGDFTYNNLTLSGSSTKDVTAALTIGGTLTLESGITFTAGAFTHDLAGNWVNNGATFNSSGSTINLNGAAQSVGGSSSTTFDNLTLAGSSTKTFVIATFMNGDLSINTGVVADLGSITTHTANTLSLNGVGQIAGTWGSTGSAATNQNDTYFTAASTGILTTLAKGPTVYYSRQTGNWDASTTWSTVTYGNATNIATFPVAGDIVNIGGGSFTVSVNVASACASITYQSNTNNSPFVSINSGITLDVSGAITIPRAQGGGTANINTMAVGAGILNAGSIAFTNGGGNQRHVLTISTGTVTVSGDVTQSGSNGSATITFTGAGLLQLGGAFLTSATATFTPSTGTVEYNGAAQTIGDFTYNNLTLSGSGAKNVTGALTIGGALTLGSGITFTAGAFTHNVAGDWINNGAAFTNAGSTINLNGAAQSIGGSSSTTFNNLTLAGSNTKTFGIATFISSDLSINTGVVADLGSITTHTANTLSYNGVGQIAGTWGSTASAAANQNDTFFTAASTGILTTVAKGPTVYYSRQTGNWDASTTWSTVTYGNATNNGTFPVTGDIVNIGGGSFTITVNVASACTSITYQSGAAFSPFVSINSGITLDVSGAITIPRAQGGGTTNVNTMAVGAGNLNAGSIDFTNGGGNQRHVLTISTGTAIVENVTQTGSNGSATITFTGAGLLQLGGTFLDSNTGTLNPGTGTVEYNGASQTIGDFTYNNLTLSGSGTKNVTGPLTIGGALTLGSGVTFTAGAYTHNVAGDWINNGATFINTSSTINLNGAAQTIGGSTPTTFNNLTLAGSNTKTFSTSTSINSTLSINTGVVANLSSITTHIAKTLALAGSGQIPGTWGSTASIATNQNNTYFTAAATGIITVTNRIYYTRQTGNWNVNSTWSTVTYGNATNSGTFPVVGDIAKIGGNLTVTVSVDAVCAFIDFESATGNTNTVTINSGIILDVSDDITIPRSNNPNINTMAVGAGILNVGSIAFTNGGGAQRHVLSISTGTITVSGDITQSGSTGSATITFTGAGLLKLGGAFLDSGTGTLTPSTGTVEYNGSVAQTISDFTYYNLTLNNTFVTTPQLTLIANTTVTNTLTMTSGIVNLAGFTFTLGASGAASTLTRTASTTTNWVYGGTFRRFWPASTAVTSTSGNFYGLFPIGTSSASSYRPVEINSTVSPSGTGSFSVAHTDATTVTDLSPVFNDGGTNIVRKHDAQNVTASTVTGGTYDIGVTMTDLSAGTLSDIRLAVSNGASTVITVGTHVGATGTALNPTAGRAGVSLANLIGDFRIATSNSTNTPLPIELVYFNAEVFKNTIQLTWSTASELNNDFFTVQRSLDAETWQEVKKVKGAGTIAEKQTYQVLDTQPHLGESYYRLMQTDFDGLVSFSSIERVIFNGTAGLVVHPNPSSGLFRLSGMVNMESSSIKVYNSIGQLVTPEVSHDSGELLIDLISYPQGVYILQVADGQSLRSVRIIKR